LVTNEALTVSVNQASKLLGLSRNATFAAVNRGDIYSIKIGRRLLIPKARLLAMIQGDQNSEQR